VSPRLAVVGLGRIGCGLDMGPGGNLGQTHAGAARLCPGLELAGGADPDPGRREAFRLAFGVPAFASAEEMFAALRPDMAAVATPPDLHADGVLAALDGGVRAVVCEKPLEADPRRAGELVRQCRERGAILAVAHWMRWSAPWTGAARMLREGGLGTPRRVRYLYSKGLFNSGTHALDILRLLFGEIAEVRAEGASMLDTGEPNVDGRVRFRNGLEAELRTLDYREHFTTECDILGGLGRLVLGDEVRLLRPAGPGGRLEPMTPPFPTADAKSPFVALYRDLARILEHGGEPRCTGRDALSALLTARALLRSLEEGGRTIIPESPDHV